MEILSPAQKEIFSKTGKKYIILGEVHGSRQNILLAEEILKLLKGRKVAVCMEWELSAEENEILKEYLLGERTDLPAFSFFYNEGSGRFSTEHRNFLDRVRDLNREAKNPIAVFGYDHAKEIWNDGESLNAAAIRNIVADFDTIIICCGNLHARNKEFTDEGEQYVPLGSYFNESESIHVRCTYESGSFLNYTESFGIHDALDFKAESEIDDEFFDLKISIAKSDPVHQFI